MSKKQDYILDYIRKLETGTKVSIRSLADTLLVSEGTAYKAIKKAEELGLVHTRPRAGTVRIADQETQNKPLLTLKEIIHQLGLSEIVAGNTDIVISSIIVGDGSSEQLAKDCMRTSGEKLCIVGNRPEIQHEALSLGMHLLTTGETEIPENVISTALITGKCILSSQHSCHNLLFLLHDLEGFMSPSISMNKASDWMHTPDFLYYNDIYADWYRVYSPVYTLNDKYAIVDDDLNICGILNSSSSMNASPENRISDLYAHDIDWNTFCVKEDMPMHNLVQKMISENTGILYMEDNGKLKGYITANDVLRYYYHTNAPDLLHDHMPIELISSRTNETNHTYKISLPASNTSLTEDFLFRLAFEVSKKHVESVFRNVNCKLNGGTFYSSNTFKNTSCLEADSLLVSQSASSCMIEIEIMNNTVPMIKCMFSYTIITNN